MAKAAPAQQARITRSDLESKFREFQGDIQGRVDDKKQTLVASGTGIAVFLMIVFFLLGRRSGKKKTTLVEIRRV